MANIITGIRIICSIALLFCPTLSGAFYSLYIIAGFTDMIDGTIAIKTGTVSEFGSKLDTVADFIFPVYDKGEKHMACIFGGATPPWGDDEGKEIQMQSITKFMDAAKENGCDVALTNHTVFDCGLERITYSRARLSYLPNIYVIGEDGVQKFCDVFRRVCK